MKIFPDPQLWLYIQYNANANLHFLEQRVFSLFCYHKSTSFFFNNPAGENSAAEVLPSVGKFT